MNTGLYFSCTIDGYPESTFDITHFTLDEALSELFDLTIRVSTSRPHFMDSDIDLDSLLLQKAKFEIRVDGEVKRTVNGIIEEARLDNVGFKLVYYTFKIRPTMWLLTLTQDSRIFHFKSVPEILDELLAKYDIVFDKQLMDPHATREYTTQKRETDYDFFRRLASEEGVMFWFEENQLFYSDSHLGMMGGHSLIYNPHPQATTKEYTIHSLNYASRMRSNEASLRDYRYSHPKVELMFSEKKGNQPVYSVYDSYGRFHDDAMGKQFAKYRTDALQADSMVGTGKSNCSEMVPGRIFSIKEHPLDAMNKTWQVVRIVHTGTQPQSAGNEINFQSDEVTSLTNEFSFIPGLADWRPTFIHKALADGDEIATVVGPAGEEIYVNEDGAVKVAFYWNRYDAPDENASCWVRVMQNWNGDGFGFVATPRIGQEVIVSYLNGDIDRPIITGTVYNGNNRPPLKLPGSKTQTTIKTKTHKGEGFNELRFDDDNGKQEIYIHAQKDMNTKVLHDRTTTVNNDHTETVDGHQSIEIQKNQTQTILGNQTETIDGNQTVLVKQNQAETVALAKAETIGLAKALSIGTAYQTTVGLIMNTSVGINQSTQVGNNYSALAGQNYSITAKTISLSAEEREESIGKTAAYSSGDYLELVCGKARIVLTKEGGIYLKGTHIELQALSGINGDAGLIQWNGGVSKPPPDKP